MASEKNTENMQTPLTKLGADTEQGGAAVSSAPEKVSEGAAAKTAASTAGAVKNAVGNAAAGAGDTEDAENVGNAAGATTGGADMGSADKKTADKKASAGGFCSIFRRGRGNARGEKSEDGGKRFRIFARVASVLIAFGIWAYAAENDTVRSEISLKGIPIAVSGEQSSTLSVISGYNNTLDLVLSGNKSIIRTLSSSDVTASVDISDYTSAGKYTVPISLDLPDGTSVVSQSLTDVSVYLDISTSVTVPVNVRYTNYMIEEGYELGEGVPSESTVTVTGPKSVVETISYALAELDLGRIEKTVKMSSKLSLVDSSGETVTNPYVKLQTSEVTVTVALYTEKTVPLSVDTKYGYLTSKNSVITITPSSVTVKGEPSTLDALDEITIATLDEKHLSGDTMTQKIVLPDGVYMTDGTETATINVKHVGTSLRTMTVDNITVENPGGLSYELVTESVEVKLRGPTEALAELTSDSVKATLELSFDKSVTGSSSVPLKITVAGDGIYEIGDYSAVIKINP